MTLQLQIRYGHIDYKRYSLEVLYRSNHKGLTFRNRVASLDLHLVKELLKHLGYLDDYTSDGMVYFNVSYDEDTYSMQACHESIFFQNYFTIQLIKDLVTIFIEYLLKKIDLNGRIR